MKFDLCIPARNEAAHIQDAVRRLARSMAVLSSHDPRTSSDHRTPNFECRTPQSGMEVDWRIIVAVNGTTDDTLERVDECRISNVEYRDRISALQCPIAGKGAAIKYAVKTCHVSPVTCHDDLFGFIDADLSSDPDAIPGMVERIVNGEADIVIASRLVQTKTTNRSWVRTLTSRMFNFASWLLLGLNVKDAQCGLKIMNARGREVLLACKEDGWFLDIEFLAKARQDGLKILEIPVPWLEFRYPDRKSQIRHFRDGVGALRAMLRIRRSI